MKRSLYNNGFTMIELVVVLAIITFVMLMATNFIGFSLKSYTHSNTQWEIQQDARHAAAVITNDVRSADSIMLTTEGPSNIIKPYLVIDDRVKYYKKNGDSRLYRNANGTENFVIETLDSISYPGCTAGDYSNKVLTLKISTKKTGFNNVFDITTELYSRLH